MIELTIERISAIIAGLKNMVRDGSRDNIQEFNLFESWTRSKLLVENNYRQSKVELIGNIPKEIKIKAQLVQFEQCITNLLNNARDAVEPLSDKWVRVDYKEDEQDHIIYITDSGKGIPKSVRKKIMQPMFTTKDVGKGTGLGLNFVKKVLTSYGGDLNYIDKENTCFEMRIPKNI